jgi:hypothetical protein
VKLQRGSGAESLCSGVHGQSLWSGGFVPETDSLFMAQSKTFECRNAVDCCLIEVAYLAKKLVFIY